MLTDNHLIDAFDLLEANGFFPPWFNKPQARVDRLRGFALDTWMGTFGQMEPAAFGAMIGGWINGTDRRWPIPGLLKATLAPVGVAALPDADAAFEWAVAQASKARPLAAVLDLAAEQWTEAARAPLRQALSSVGGLRGLGTAPIDVAYGGSSAARGSYARRFRDGWTKAVELAADAERRALPSATPTALMGA